MKKKKLLFILAFFCAFNVYAQDALRLYRNGRDYDAAGRTADARAAYNQAIAICQAELKENPRNMDSYTVYTWSLFRLKRYQETVQVCNQALRVSSDVRIIETLGEAHFYLGNYEASLSNMQTYVDRAPTGDRASVAYFFIGEIYRLQEKYNKADAVYSHAVYLEPNSALWWYRLGSVREASGNTATALEAYQRALRLNPNYTAAAEAVKRLRR